MTTEISTASSVAKNFQPGDKLAGCYTLKQILPFDGPGVVWLAHDDELNKDLTLHFLPDTVVADARAMGEIKQESKRNRQIVHPHILRVHDLIEEDNWAALTMDYAEGETIAALKKKKENGVFSVSELSAWIPQLCQTLEDAHKIDLLHRDLAPENLLVTKSGVTVLNFGISRAVLDSLSRSGQKVHGDGNLAFMSPQQIDGERPNRWDDIYSFGAVIYDLLTSLPPFYKDDLIAQIRKAVPPLMSERRQELGIAGEPIPKAWDKAIASCLEKPTAQRPKNALELAAMMSAGKGEPEVAEENVSGAAAQTAADEASSGEPAAPDTPAVPGKKAWGPGKTPVITEATVVSQTSLGKKSETEDAGATEFSPGERRAGPTTPSGFPLRAFVGVEEGRAARKNKVPKGALIGAAVVIIAGIAAYAMFSGSDKKESSFTPGVTQIEPAQNVSTQRVVDQPVKASGPARDTETSPSPVESARPVKVAAAPPIVVAQASATPSPIAIATPTNPPAMATPTVPPAPTPMNAAAEPNSKIAQAMQLANEKAKAAAAARQQLAATNQAAADKAKSQQIAVSALKEVQDSVQQKTALAAAAKKSAEEAAAAQKQREEAEKKAQADADQAQKMAAEKARLAAEAHKAAADNSQTVKQQQIAVQRAEAEVKEMQRVVADRQRAVDDATKAAAAGDGARKQAEASIKQSDAEFAAAQSEIDKIRSSEQAKKAAEEAEKVRVAREVELKRITEQATLAAKAAADAQKALQDAQRQFDEAQKLREKTAQEAAAAAKGEAPAETPLPASSPSAKSTPSAPPVLAMQTTTKTPSLTVNVPKAKVDQTLENSLGMKFASLDGVLISVWQTRMQDYNAFAKATGLKSTAWMQPGFKQGPDHPVVNVSWNDAMAFCKWLTEKERKEGVLNSTEAYRLPTDAEWSNAVGLPEENGRTAEARDMDVPDQYPWGTQWPPPQGAGNYTGEETGSDVAIKGYDDGFAWTSPVGSFPPNKAGLYDMGGNVWQWCMDWWNDEHKHKVLRGGSWYNGALKLSLLSSCRVHAAPDTYTDNYGFRVVLASDKAGKR